MSPWLCASRAPGPQGLLGWPKGLVRRELFICKICFNTGWQPAPPPARLPSCTTAAQPVLTTGPEGAVLHPFFLTAPSEQNFTVTDTLSSVCLCAAVTHTRALCITDRECFSSLPKGLGTGTHTYFPATSTSFFSPGWMSGDQLGLKRGRPFCPAGHVGEAATAPPRPSAL